MDDTDWALMDFDEPKRVSAKTVEWVDAGDVTTWKPVAKGTCPKCGKHIGKGIAGHKKACKG